METMATKSEVLVKSESVPFGRVAFLRSAAQGTNLAWPNVAILGGKLKRRVFVVIDHGLPDIQRSRIENYFAWHKAEKLLEDYTTMSLAVTKTEKTLGKVMALVATAKHFRIGRRDLFVAIGGSTVIDVVGFMAAIYRRSTPYIAVSTDLVGIIRSHAGDNRVTVNHLSDSGELLSGVFAVSHPPVSSFYEPAFLDSSPRSEIKRGLAEMVRIAVIRDDELFSYMEAHLEEILADTQDEGHLMAAVELTARAVSRRSGGALSTTDDHLPLAMFGEEAVQAIEQIKAVDHDDADSVAIGVALMSALSFLQGNLSSADLERVLSLCIKAGLPICDEILAADALWTHMTGSVQDRDGDSVFIVPVAVGQGGYLSSANVSAEHIDKVLNLLRDYRATSDFKIVPSELHVPDTGNGVYESASLDEVRYHVISVQKVFSRNNPTLIQNYCRDDTNRYKKKILVVVDDYEGNAIPDIEAYFKIHCSAIHEFRILPIHVSSKGKTIDSVKQVINAAISFSISPRDLLIVVGGGTLMDIVGFAAAIYKGGIPHLRIPTTLLGIIDAGVGVKVGVNFEERKNFLGRFFAPVACLNDPAAFLPNLPRREFACGLAEAIKMAVIKDLRLFEMIERHHRSVEYNTYTHDLTSMAVRGMLEELQPNLEETDLRRTADFGHELGHIVESLAHHEIPHGECVAIGMAISSFLAHLKGIVSPPDLERILNLILNVGLPIYVTDHDCCDPNVLWAKIQADGTEHKGGMMFLTVPETVGRARILDKTSEINSGMLNEAVLSLQRYAAEHADKRVSMTDGLDETSLVATLDDSMSEVDRFSPSATAAIIGASGDIGSNLANYLVRNGVKVICSVRPASLHRFKARVNYVGPLMRVFVGDMLDLENLRKTIWDADIIYNMAGVVTLGARPEEFARVIAVNGFAQGVITHWIQQAGKGEEVKVVYPSSQRVHLALAHASVDTWVREAVEAFSAHRDALVDEQDISTALETFAAQFLVVHPLPTQCNVYEISKRLGEHLVSRLPQHCLMRISGVYGPGFTRGFIARAVHPQPEGNVEAAEKRDFIYIDDLNDLLWKAAQTPILGELIFDGASGERKDLQEVWKMIRDLRGDHGVTIVFNEDVAQDDLVLDPAFARHLLGRDFLPIHLGLARTVFAQTSEIIRRRRVDQPHVIVLDVGATYLRVGVMNHHGHLLPETSQAFTPSKQFYPRDTLAELQERLIKTIVREIELVRDRHRDLSLEEVGLAIGSVLTRDGIMHDASNLWSELARGYNFKEVLQGRLPGVRLTVLNDVSAAAWRYKDEKRFCLITVSSGLGSRTFNSDLGALDQLDLDAARLGGEMGHVVVEPRAVDALVQNAILRATACPEEFKSSRLYVHANGTVQKINVRSLGLAVKENDDFAVRLLDEAGVPSCFCGNLADLSSYSSGRGALSVAQMLARRGEYGVAPQDVTNQWLHDAIADGHPLARKVLYDATYPLALRILQLGADMGLDKFIIRGGFPMKTARGAYLPALQTHLVRFHHDSGFFSGWTEEQVRGLVRLGVDDDYDGLIGAGQFVQHLRAQKDIVERC